MRGLVEAGHDDDVTMISPFKLKNPPKNGIYSDVVLEGLSEEYEKILVNESLFDLDWKDPLHKLKMSVNMFLEYNNKTLHHPNVKKLPLPLVPNMIEIGGFFIDPPKKLPNILSEFLDNAKEGAIYFSMGSHLRGKDLTEDKKKMILNVFGQLQLKVIWKYEESLCDKPSNIFIGGWLPQQDILRHPNIRLFITHAGLLSITEAAHFGVPILAIPVFVDQRANADRAVARGYGLKLEYNDPNFTEDNFGGLVRELLNNQKYRDNAQRVSKIYHDRPMFPMETAVYWIEYIIRHKDVGNLKNRGIHLVLYQYYFHITK